MHRISSQIVFFIASALILGGCAGAQHRQAAKIKPQALELKRIAVGDVEVKAAKATMDVGSGIRQMLILALANNHRFAVIEFPGPLSASKAQHDSPASRPVPTGKTHPLDPDVIIGLSIEEFEPEASGGNAGVGGGGVAANGLLGGLLSNSSNAAHIALDIRIIDASSHEVLTSGRVQGQAYSMAEGFMSNLFGRHGLKGGLAIYANTPMERALRLCIIEAVRFISQNIT